MKSSIPNTKDLVLIGGGHSHAIALKKFGMQPMPGVRLTLITDVSHTPYSGMLPGYVAGLYSFDQCHIDLRPLAKFAQATMIVDQAIGLDLESNRVLCANRPPVAFDLLSIDIGSTPAAVTVPGAAAYTIPAKPISQFLSYWREVTQKVSQFPQQKIRLAIVGGGAGGVELALSVQAHLQDIYHQAGQPRQNLEMHLFQRGAKLLPERNPWVGKQLEQILKHRGVKLHLQEEVCGIEVTNQTYFQGNLPKASRIGKNIGGGSILLPEITIAERNSPEASPEITASGQDARTTNLQKWDTPNLPKLIHTQSGLTVECDYIFWVTQASAAPWLKKAGLATNQRGFLQVSDTLQSISHPQVFAAGDVATMINHPRPKAGVFAVRQGEPLYKNLRRVLQNKSPKPFIPQKQFLILIGTGDQKAIASRGWLGFGPHPLIWRWKDYIDRQFMEKFSNLAAEMKSDVDVETLHATSRRQGKEQKLSITNSSMRCTGCGAKVGGSILEKVLKRIKQEAANQPQREDIIIGLDTPDDAAVVKVPTGQVMVQTIDYFPALIDDPFLLGKITTNHCLSDLFAMGAKPQSALAVATLPYSVPTKLEETLYQLLAGATQVLTQAGAVLIGGHTTEGEQLAFGLTCNGLAIPEQLLRKGGMQPGQVLILTKALGTGTLFAADMRLQAKGRWIERAIESMLVSNQEAATCLQQYQASACTDVTGFGLIGHLLEMVKASQVAVELDLAEIPVLPGVKETLKESIFSSLYPENLRFSNSIENLEEVKNNPLFPLLFDPQTSGGLLATVPVEQASQCLSSLNALGYHQSCVIGQVSSLVKGNKSIKIKM